MRACMLELLAVPVPDWMLPIKHVCASIQEKTRSQFMKSNHEANQSSQTTRQAPVEMRQTLVWRKHLHGGAEGAKEPFKRGGRIQLASICGCLRWMIRWIDRLLLLGWLTDCAVVYRLPASSSSSSCSTLFTAHSRSALVTLHYASWHFFIHP